MTKKEALKLVDEMRRTVTPDDLCEAYMTCRGLFMEPEDFVFDEFFAMNFERSARTNVADATESLAYSYNGDIA